MEVPALVGKHVRLDPLQPSDAPELAQAVLDGDLHRNWFTWIPSPDEMAAEIDRRIALETMYPFAIRAADGRAVGMTMYLNMNLVVPRVEIGGTWLAKSMQRTPINTEAKLLLLTHAFDAIGCASVDLRTHWLNQQSRRAIERLGAKLDGILRANERMANGTLRDTAAYSIVASEWPAVQAGLRDRLGLS